MTESVFCPQGIPDPTPAQAIKAERKRPNAGEIWLDDKGRYVIVLAANDGYCLVCWLTSNCNNPAMVKLDNRLLYTNPCMVTYMLERSYGDKVGDIDVDTFGRIKSEAQSAMGISGENMQAMREQINELRAERDKYRKESMLLMAIKDANAMKTDEIGHMKRHIAALKQEISAYKRTCRILANELRYTKPTTEEGEDDEDMA